MLEIIKEFILSPYKKPSSQVTSEELEKIFKESEFCRSHFFPKEVPYFAELDKQGHKNHLSQKNQTKKEKLEI